jgi:hypothetical protein
MSQFIGMHPGTRRIEFKYGAIGKPEPGMPVTGWIAFPTSTLVWVPWQGRLEMSKAPTPTSVYEWTDAGPAWVERAPLKIVAARAIAAVDAEGDAARLLVIGDPTKVLEYQLAEAQARPYAGAGYPDPVPECVASWADAKRWANGGAPWTGQQAADDIITTADRWYSALESIRRLRLDAKERVRAMLATGAALADVDAIAAQFSTDLSNLMKGLQ